MSSGEMILKGENRRMLTKLYLSIPPVPAALYPTQIPQEVPWEQTWVSTVKK
jgi:hypothetical protein